MTDQQAAAPAAEAATPVEMKSRAVPSDAPVVEAPKPEQVAEAPVVVDGTGDEFDHEGGNPDESATSDGDDAPAKRQNKGVGKRINELTREKHEALREAAHWKELALKGNKPDEPPPTVDKPAQAEVEGDEPTLESCDYDVEAYTRKHYEWRREQDRKQEQVQSTLRTLREKESAFTAEHPDYEEVAKAPHVPVTRSMAEAMLGTDNPPAVAYYLGQNLDEAADIAKQSPIQQAISIGRIAERLSAEPPSAPSPVPPKKTTNAPPPPKTVSGAGKPQPTEDDPGISTAQRIALWKQQRGTRS